MRALGRARMPASQADAAVEVAEDSTRGFVTQDQLEATLNRALAIQAAVIITVIIVAQTAIMAVLLLVFSSP